MHSAFHLFFEDEQTIKVSSRRNVLEQFAFFVFEALFANITKRKLIVAVIQSEDIEFIFILQMLSDVSVNVLVLTQHSVSSALFVLLLIVRRQMLMMEAFKADFATKLSPK